MFAKNLRLRVSKAKANDVSAGFHANFHIWPLKFVEGISHGEICASLTVPLKKKSYFGKGKMSSLSVNLPFDLSVIKDMLPK